MSNINGNVTNNNPMDTVRTQTDGYMINLIINQFTELRNDMREDTNRLDTKVDIFRKELKSDIDKLGNELREDTKELNGKVDKLYGGIKTIKSIWGGIVIPAIVTSVSVALFVAKYVFFSS